MGLQLPPNDFLYDRLWAHSPTIQYSFNRLQDAQGTPHSRWIVRHMLLSWIHLGLCLVSLDSLCYESFDRGDLARIASDLGGSPVVGPSLFKAGIVLSFLARSFLSSGLGAIEALILSSSLRPRCLLLFLFTRFCLARHTAH